MARILAAGLAVAGLGAVCGIRLHEPVEFSASAPAVVLISDFGVTPGAQLRVNAVGDGHWVFLVDTSEQLDVTPARVSTAFGPTQAQAQMCVFPAAGRLEIVAPQENTTSVLGGPHGSLVVEDGPPSALPATLTIPFGGLVSLVAVTCGNASITATMDVSLTNPVEVLLDATGRAPAITTAHANAGQQHLSVSRGAVPALEQTVGAVTGITLVVWGGITVAYRYPLRPLHWLILLWGVCMVVHSFLKSASELHTAGGGEEAPQSSLGVASGLMGTAVNLTFLAVSAFAGLGLSLTTRTISLRASLWLAGGGLVYAALSIPGVLCEDDGTPVFLGATTCQALALGEFVVFSLCILGVVVMVNYTINTLRREIAEPALLRGTYVAYEHIAGMRAFRGFFLGYLLAPTVNLIIALSLLRWQNQWTTSAFVDTLNFAMLVYLLQVFGPGSVGKMATLRQALASTGSRSAVVQM